MSFVVVTEAMLSFVAGRWMLGSLLARTGSVTSQDVILKGSIFEVGSGHEFAPFEQWRLGRFVA